MNYWQIGSGDSERDYSQVFFDFSVALVGPGNLGDFKQKRDLYEKNCPKEIAKIEPLLKMKKGDRIILRKGRQKILAVGEVVDGEYGYSHLFSDIDGWDLQHYISVHWRRLDYDFAKSILSMSTLEGLYQSEVIDLVNKNWDNSQFIEKKYELSDIQVLDPEKDILREEDLEMFLIEKGLRIHEAENMTKTINRVKKLGMWYLDALGEKSSEHEVRTFLVIPFLHSLGWSEQTIGIEVPVKGRKRIDIVLYSDTSRNKPIVLIETKKIWTGLRNAFHQIAEYANEFSTVQYLITTDGLRYSLFTRRNGGWQEIAYMNFRSMLNRHCCYEHINGMTYMIDKLLSKV